MIFLLMERRVEMKLRKGEYLLVSLIFIILMSGSLLFCLFCSVTQMLKEKTWLNLNLEDCGKKACTRWVWIFYSKKLLYE